MNDSFDQLKGIWLSSEEQFLPTLDKVQAEISHLRQQKKNRIAGWYTALIFFSVGVVGYVLYTDELKSRYQSLSEIMLLLTALYLFRHSWKILHQQRKEYLLSNLDFVKTIGLEESHRTGKQLLVLCRCGSLFLIALFFHFLPLLLSSLLSIFYGLAVLIALLLSIWVGIKPIYGKRIVANRKHLLTKTADFLTHIND